MLCDSKHYFALRHHCYLVWLSDYYSCSCCRRQAASRHWKIGRLDLHRINTDRWPHLAYSFALLEGNYRREQIWRGSKTACGIRSYIGLLEKACFTFHIESTQ